MTRLTAIIVAVLFDDERVRAAAGYFVTKGAGAPELVWNGGVEEAAGSAALDQAIRGLGQDLLDNQQTALERFLDAIRAL